MLMLVVFQACNESATTTVSEEPEPPMRHCGYSQLYEARTEDGRAVGAFELKNDEKDLWAVFFPATGFQLESVSLYWGEKEKIPMKADGTPDVDQFEIVNAKPLADGGWHKRLYSKDPIICGTLIANVEASHSGDLFSAWVTKSNLGSRLAGVEYCRQSCSNLAKGCALDIPDQMPITVTQSQWISKDQAQNGQLEILENHFKNAFPDGLTIGCEHRCVFNSVEALMNILPLAGAANALEEELVDPEKGTIENRLLGELIALKLTIGFDHFLTNFSPAPMELVVLEISDGAFKGWSIGDLLTEAESVIGGCATNYSPQQIMQVIINVNEAFASPARNSGFLRCPENE